MRSQLVLTLIGRDRPGLVEALAAEVARHGGNWEESRMARLSGQFAGLLRVSVPEGSAQALTNGLASLSSAGLKLIVEPAHHAEPSARGRRMRLELVGNDHEGIVHDLARVLSRRNVNVEELHTSCEAAPMAGGMLFRASALVLVPADAAVKELQKALENLADDLMVELSLAAMTDEHKP